jgi:hypothetical protein
MMKYENEAPANTNNKGTNAMTTTNPPAKSKAKLVTISDLMNDAFQSGDHANWMKLFEAFRGKIAQDQKVLIKHEVAGRNILYSQLADAYRIGLAIINNLTSKKGTLKRSTLDWLASEHSIQMKKDVSPWVYIVKLLYGTWFSTKEMTEIEEQTYSKKIGALKGTDHNLKRRFNLGQLAPVLEVPEQEKTVYQEWRPNRSSEKYAPVFRYLHNHGVTPEDLPAFIEGFKHGAYGTRLAGIEAASRAEARLGAQPKPKSADAIQREKSYVTRAENRMNWNVFEIETPPTFPQDFTYARAVIKQEGKSLLVVLTDDRDKPMKESAYTSQAIKLGKPLVEKDEEADKKRQDELDAAWPDANSVISGVTNMAAQAIANGADPEEIRKHQEEFFRSLNIKQQGTQALEGFAVPDAI